MFMPWEYEKGDALYMDWQDYHGEIEMYICSHAYITDEPGRYCAHITDEAVIKDVLEEYMKVKNVTHSREEWEAENFPEDWGDDYIIEISRVDSRDSDGNRDEGEVIFYDHINSNTTWSKSYKGVYYYYHITDDLHDFVINYDDENIQ